MRRRRTWRARLAELLLWVAIAVGTAVALVVLTEKLAPPNF
ncbi:MAG: hypothetical protein ABR529_04215 [Actinomycetota bacterium]